MPESFVETQVRLVLQQQAGALCKYLHEAMLVGAFEWDLSAIAFDFGATGNAAYATSLAVPTFVETLEVFVSSISGNGPPRSAPRNMTPDFLRSLADAAKEFLPAGVGFALFVGDAGALSYVSNADRGDVLTMLGTELLPKLKGAEPVKIIESGWESYRRQVVPASASQVQIDETRNGFYAGASHLL